MDSQEVVINGTFTLMCVAEGFPTPAIIWFMNNTMISNGVSDVDMAMNVRTSRLTISNASFSDSGMYYCEAESSEFVDLNVTSGIANIAVVGKLVNDIILCYTINYAYNYTQIRMHKLMLNPHCKYYTHYKCTHTHGHSLMRTHVHGHTHIYRRINTAHTSHTPYTHACVNIHMRIYNANPQISNIIMIIDLKQD